MTAAAVAVAPGLVDLLATYPFLRTALATATVVGVVCAVLSCLLVVRRQALLGDALAHAVLLGVALGYVLVGDIGVRSGALAAALVSGLAIAALPRRTRLAHDASMGVVFSAAFALGLAIMSVARPRGVDLFHVLFGDVLGVQPSDLAFTAGVGALVLAVVLGAFRAFHLWSFDPEMAKAMGVPTGLVEYSFTALLSATVVVALQTVGVVLVVAMLITPGATAALVTSRLSRMMLVAAAVGLVSSWAGLAASFAVPRLASGPAIVLGVSVCFVVALAAHLWGRRRRTARAAEAATPVAPG